MTRWVKPPSPWASGCGRLEGAASVAWTFCIAASRVDDRFGGTTKFTFESATIEQARSLRSVDKTFKGIHKELRRRVNHTVSDAGRIRLTAIQARRPVSSNSEANDDYFNSDDSEVTESETEAEAGPSGGAAPASPSKKALAVVVESPARGGGACEGPHQGQGQRRCGEQPWGTRARSGQLKRRAAAIKP